MTPSELLLRGGLPIGIVVALGLAVPHGTPEERAEIAVRQGSPEIPAAVIPMNDFSFLEGHWRIRNRRLAERMRGSTEWIEYEMDYEFRELLDGLANTDRISGELDGRMYEAINFRAYDPDADEWVVYWMSRSYPHLTEQVRGRFQGGEGVFYGSEESRGVTYRMRFRWRRTGADQAWWDQAYQDPATGTWEINWTMEMWRPE